MSLIFRIRLPRKNVRRGTENRRMIFPSGHGIMGRKRKNGARLSGNGGYGQKMERWIWGWLAVINIVTFLAYGLDKWKARHHRWRISEGMLLFLAAAGGSAGALLAMYGFRHKTKHRKFTAGVPAILCAQIALGMAVMLW